MPEHDEPDAPKITGDAIRCSIVGCGEAATSGVRYGVLVYPRCDKHATESSKPERWGVENK